jgi:hypothetical protein
MDSRTSPFAVDAKTDAVGMELQYTCGFGETGQTFDSSQKQARTDAESASVAAQADKNPENIHRPKGIRFAFLFTSILF